MTTTPQYPLQSKTTLYRVVFGHVLSSVITLMLLVSFLLQPLKAQANTTVTPEVLPVITDELVEEVTAVIEETAALPTLPPDTETTAATADVEDSADAETTSVIEEPSQPTDTPETMIPVDTSPPPDTDSGGEPAPSSSGDNVETLPLDLPPIDTGQASSSDFTSETVGATSTPETDASSTPLLTVESDMVIQFNKENCMAVDDGTFYCQQATTTTTDTDGLFALPDQDGDLEIYLKRSGELTQLTHNRVDDAAPYYDPASDSIVWHRLVDDRYQIVVYDVGSGEEEQLTDTAANNMEPFRADNYITWQHWDNDAWQVMLYDGTTLEQLTKTREHNLAPTVRNGLVVWSRIAGDEKTIEVYDIAAKSYMTISDDEGGAISNPRMVLVYEAALENGDVVTKGYDLITGEITSFAATPRELPAELPDPEATGETKALINAKQTEEELESDSDGSEPTASSTPPLADGGLSLDLSATSSPTAELETDVVYTLDLSATSSAVVVEPAPAAPAIPDVVILPFSEAVAEALVSTPEQ